MSRRLIWSGPARGDVDAIAIYFREIDRDVGRRIVTAIRERAKLLTRHPFAGEPLDEVRRKLSVDRFPYVIVYRIGSDAVSIIRIHHAAQDWRPA
jgi:plasmid stabilization system protein ParE